MSQLVADCPRCRSNQTTFDLISYIIFEIHYGWQHWYEAFCICRHCLKSTVFVLSDKGVTQSKYIDSKKLNNIDRSVNDFVTIEDYISTKDAEPVSCPEHVPEEIRNIFNEGARCLSVGCFNAAGAMFRLCVDLATKSMLPKIDEKGLNSKIRRNLGLRLPWLFETAILPIALQDLSMCIKEDGNDGAHDGSLSKEDAEDLLDFIFALLERVYTEPERLRVAKERREARRA